MLLARRVKLSVDDLLNRDATLSHVAGEDDNVRFKISAGTNRSDLDLAQHLVTPVARAAMAGVRNSTHDIPSAEVLRAEILKRWRPYFGFAELLEYCWCDLGIPVLPVSTFPPGSIKMDGLATNIDGRPVIVISKEMTQPAWLLFILAHEVGHIGSGHVGRNQTLVDSDVVKTANQDLEEEQANAYATLLLRGPVGKTLPKRVMAADTLVDRAVDLGKSQQIDPGHLILSYARDKGAKGGANFWGVANKALRLLDSRADGFQLMRAKLAQHLDWTAFSDDVAEYIRRMTGLESLG